LPPCCHDLAPRSALLKRGIHQHTSSSTPLASSKLISWNRSSRSIYTGSLTNFGLMALGGIAAIAVKRNRWLAKTAPFALLLYLACPALALAVGRDTVANLLFWGSGFLAAVVLVGIVSNQSSWMVKLLEMPPVRYVGTISYGVYVYHSIVGISFLNLFSSTANGSRLQSMIEIALSIAVASASWHFIERPLLNYRDRRRLRNRELAFAEMPGQANHFEAAARRH
jgi:peptidoglycan/LPS O-acetylase OafA/YrhL